MSRGGELVQKMHAAERFSEEWTEAIREIIDTVNKQEAALRERDKKIKELERERDEAMELLREWLRVSVALASDGET